MGPVRFLPMLALLTLAGLGACILAGVLLVRIVEWVWWLVT
jgi:hypothetical protein